MFGEILDQFSRNRLLEKFFGDGTAIARVGDHSDLVFDLHHYYCVIASIHFTQVAHESCKRTRSASTFSLLNAERISMLRPAASRDRGKRRWSVFTHAGA